MESLYLREIESALGAAGDLANELLSTRKKARKNARHRIETILKPKLFDISNKEVDTFYLIGRSNYKVPFHSVPFHSFVSDYFDLIKNLEFEKASKEAFSYIRDVRRNYISINEIDF
jgi:hypothetical protein